jgi:hypothetical protein
LSLREEEEEKRGDKREGEGDECTDVTDGEKGKNIKNSSKHSKPDQTRPDHSTAEEEKGIASKLIMTTQGHSEGSWTE